MPLSIIEVRNQRELDRFIDLPWSLYPGRYPHWVPPLRAERRAFLDPKRNPFFEFGEVSLFLALDSRDKPVGRIAAIVNPRHTATHGDRTGFFGLFECVDDPAVASALFETAAGFLRARGLSIMRGPVSLSINDEAGLLVDGFDRPPTILMPYNPPYYEGLVLSAGFLPVRNLLAYEAEVPHTVPERLERGASVAQARRGFTVRPVRMEDFDAEVRRVQAVYTSAWADNWGAVAMTDREFEHLARTLRPVIDPELCFLAEVDGEVAGFSLALPDLNQALIHVRSGRLFPLGFLKVLWHQRHIDTVRIITMGVVKKYRHLGIDARFYASTYQQAAAKGIRRGEASWILDSNTPMIRALEKMGFRITKTYRVYDRPL